MRRFSFGGYELALAALALVVFDAYDSYPFGGYGLALAALALVVFGAIECPPPSKLPKSASPFSQARRWTQIPLRSASGKVF